MMYSESVRQRFESHVDRNGPSGCWLWTAYVRPNGYGRFMLAAGKAVYAHRMAYELWAGPIPVGKCIDHRCRVRVCVNPAHLQAVTQSENLHASSITLNSRYASRERCEKHDLRLLDDETRGYRYCEECRREWRRRSWHRKYHQSPMEGEEQCA